MYPQKTRLGFSPRLAAICLAVLAASCSTTSTSFLEDQAGFSVTKGRILRIENLHSEVIVPLADGVALTLSRDGCRVALEFPDGRQQALSMPAGGIVICADDADYLLRAERGDGASTPDDR